MADYTKTAFYKVRRWMIDELYKSGVINPSHYINSSPLIPIQQIPEAEDNLAPGESGFPEDAPFIVYDILISGSYDTDFWNCRDEVMLWIYDYDIEKLFEIKEVLYDLFHRLDLSATDINEFSDDINVLFHYSEIMMGLPTNEIDQVLGRYGMNMVLSYEYTRPILANGRLA